MVDDIEARDDKLSEYERVFISDIGARQRDLSEAQDGWLNRIWERVTADRPVIQR